MCSQVRERCTFVAETSSRRFGSIQFFVFLPKLLIFVSDGISRRSMHILKLSSWDALLLCYCIGARQEKLRKAEKDQAIEDTTTAPTAGNFEGDGRAALRGSGCTVQRRSTDRRVQQAVHGKYACGASQGLPDAGSQSRSWRDARAERGCFVCTGRAR